MWRQLGERSDKIRYNLITFMQAILKFEYPMKLLLCLIVYFQLIFFIHLSKAIISVETRTIQVETCLFVLGPT